MKKYYRVDMLFLIHKFIMSGLTFKELQEKTKQVDPDGRGLSDMACRRIMKRITSPSIKTLCLLSAALGVSPKKSFIPYSHPDPVAASGAVKPDSGS